MNDPLNDIKGLWEESKASDSDSQNDIDKLINKANSNKKQIRKIQYGNAIILSITLFILALFFIYIAPFQELLSLIGVGLMMGGLLIRIIVELYSIRLSLKTQNADQSALEMNNAMISYQKFRMKIHGAFTYSILGLYSIGFYLLIPEFSLYMSNLMTWILAASYIPAGIIFTYFIRTAIKRELQKLNELLSIHDELISE